MELAVIKKEMQDVVMPAFKNVGMPMERFNRESSFAMQAIVNSPLLQQCERASILSAVVNVAMTGLTLNPVMKHAALIPRWDNRSKSYKASLEPMYQGLLSLALQAGIKSINVQVIYAGDRVEVDLSSDAKILKHEPSWIIGNEQGEIRAVYSRATLDDGSQHTEVMHWYEIEQIMKRSESYKAFEANKIPACTWTTDRGEMARKTCLKRHLKYLAKGDERLNEAIRLDNEVNGFRAFVDHTDIEMIENMLDNLNIEDRQLNALRVRIKRLKFKDDALDMIAEIHREYHNTPDVPLSLDDINKKLDIQLAKED